MILFGLLIPLILLLSFFFKKKKTAVFLGISFLVVLLLSLSARVRIDYIFSITLSLILFSLPVFVMQMEKMSSIVLTQTNKKTSNFEYALKDIQMKEQSIKTEIQNLEKQNMAVSDLYEMAKDMSVSLRLDVVAGIFQDTLSKNFSFNQGFLVTLRDNPVSMETERIYQISKGPDREFKEVSLPERAYYKILEYMYHLDESGYVGRESSLGRRFNLSCSDGLSIALLKAENRTIGALLLEGLAREDFDRLYIFSAQFSLELKKVTLYKKIEELAITDSLTELYVRRHFSELAVEEIRRAHKHNMNLAFLMLDIDYFKRCNDRYGHLIGDYVLKSISFMLKSSLREIDIVGRYGGEEFSIILPETDSEGAKIVIERIQESIRSYDFEAYTQKFKVSLSIGVAVFPEDGKTLLKLLEAADKALYAAKNKGRNCAVFYREVNS